MKATVGFGLTTIGQICTIVHDLEAATVFYRDKLGMKFLFATPKMVFFDCNGIYLMLGLPEKPEFDHPGSIIYFNVDDINQSYELLRERGVKFEGEPHLIAKMEGYDLWMAFFRDCEENLLSIMSRVRKDL